MKTCFAALGLWLMAGVALADLPAWQAPEGRDDPHLGQVLDTASGEWINPDALVSRLAEASHVLIGEKHDNPDHHSLQHWLLSRLHAQRPQGALVMEMLGPEQQDQVDGLQGLHPGDEAELATSLNWNPGWDWTQYGPLVEWGLAHPERLLGANLDREEMLGFYRQPELLAEVFDEQARAQLMQIMRDSHCNKLPEEHLPAMLSIQQARDRRMAEVMHAAPQPALLLAGNFHVRKDLGVPMHWPESSTPPVVMLIEVGATLPDPSAADFVWLTPATAARDYCEDMP